MTIGLSLNNPEPINGRQLSAYEYSEAGLVSGIATRALIQPLDVLKIRFQLQEEPLRGSTKGKYSGVIQSIRLILKEEGPKAFWKGHVPAQGLSAIYGLCQFTMFEVLSHHLKPLPQLKYLVTHHERSIDFFCGAVAGSCAMTAAMPLDVIRTRLVAQGEPKVYRGTMHAISKIWRTEGVTGYFRGITPSLLQPAPLQGLQFAIYNFLSKLWLVYVNSNASSGALFTGAMAGTIAKTILYPLDLARHRLQVNPLIRRGFGKTTNDRGMVRTIVGVVRRESLYGLFKGLWPSMIKAGANSGFSFYFYQLAIDLLRST